MKFIEQIESKSKHCIECGKEVENTSEIFCGQFIRLTRCPHCSKTVDKYIEYDNILIFLNLLLQKKQVYRHILFNKENVFAFLLKVFIGTLFLQALVHNLFEPNIPKLIGRIILILIEDIIYGCLVSAILSFITKISMKESGINILKSYLVRSVGKIFFVLVFMWDQSQALYLFSVIMSNMIFLSSISVLFNISQMKTMIIGMCSSLIYHLVFLNLVNPGFFNYFVQLL